MKTVLQKNCRFGLFLIRRVRQNCVRFASSELGLKIEWFGCSINFKCHLKTANLERLSSTQTSGDLSEINDLHQF